MKEFGDLHLVLASYNAGERPVHRWIGERPNLSREEFIDDIPYPETQNYVRRILGTAEDYRRIYGAVAGGVLADDEIPGAPAGEAVSDVTPQSAAEEGAAGAQEKARRVQADAQASRRGVVHHMSKLTGSRKALQFTESVIREMTRLSEAHGGVNPVAGFSGLSGARRGQGGAPAPPSTPTSTSTRSHGAPVHCARRSRSRSRAATASRWWPTDRSPSAAARPRR